LSAWGDVINALAKARPAAIMIDKLFDVPYTAAQLQNFTEKVAGIDAPVVIGTFVAQSPISYRQPLRHDIAKVRAKISQDVSWPVEAGFHYGAEPEITSLTEPGHILYDGDGRMRPFVR